MRKAAGSGSLFGTVPGLMLSTLLLLCSDSFAAGDSEQRPAPDYMARKLGSTEVTSLASFKGKAVLVNTWATWCPPCRKEMPDFEKAYKRHKASGLEVTGVNIDEDEGDDEVKRFVKALGVSFTTLRDPQNRFAKAFSVLGVPETFLIDREGRIVRHWRGTMDPNAPENAQAIEAALKQANN